MSIQIMELKEEPLNLFPWRENLTFIFVTNLWIACVMSFILPLEVKVHHLTFECLAIDLL